jgi:hypothetical protein
MESGIMVNTALPPVWAPSRFRLSLTKTLGSQRHVLRRRAFVQFLAKLYFFQMLENLRRILLDYGQKRTRRANAAFKAAC